MAGFFISSLCSRHKNHVVVIASTLHSNKGAQACYHVGPTCWNTNGKSFDMSLLIMTVHS